MYAISVRHRSQCRRNALAGGLTAVGELGGFIEARPGAAVKRRPVPVRLRDWKEVYEELP